LLIACKQGRAISSDPKKAIFTGLFINTKCRLYQGFKRSSKLLIGTKKTVLK
jgi:hypothetical protein